MTGDAAVDRFAVGNAIVVYQPHETRGIISAHVDGGGWSGFWIDCDAAPDDSDGSAGRMFVSWDAISAEPPLLTAWTMPSTAARAIIRERYGKEAA